MEEISTTSHASTETEQSTTDRSTSKEAGVGKGTPLDITNSALKIENKEAPKVKNPLRPSHVPQSLVLNMYAHMRNQKKQAQEKIQRDARAERRRQKVRNENSPHRTFSDTSSLTHFGGYWTHGRLYKTQLLFGDEPSHGSVNSDISEQEGVNEDSEQKRTPKTKQVYRSVSRETGVRDQTPASELHPDLYGYRINRSASRQQTDYQTSPEMSPRNHPRDFRVTISRSTTNGKNDTSTTTTTVVTSDAISGFKNVKNTPTQTTTNNGYRIDANLLTKPQILDNDYKSDARSDMSSHSRGSNYHTQAMSMVKGPGRVQIRFSQNAPHLGSYRNRKQCYQWDAMTAGVMTSPKTSVVSFDGTMLKG